MRVINAAPDGYTFLFGSVGTHAYNQTMYKNIRYNAATDFAPVTLFADQPMTLSARKDFPASTMPEFAAHLKANAAKLQYGSAGAGSTTHLACSLVNSTIGVNITHVPYRGSAPASNDLIGGQIDYMCNNIGSATPLINGGKVKAIANLSSDRSPLMPELATAQEQGLKDFDITTWNAIFLPKGTPAAIVKQARRRHERGDGHAGHQGQDAGHRRRRRRARPQVAGVSGQVRGRRDRALGRPDQGRLGCRWIEPVDVVHALRQPRSHRRPADRYPQVPERTYLAAPAPLETLKRLGAPRGITRFVIVQPSFYGADNSATLDALDELDGNGRGVAVIDPRRHTPERWRTFHRRGVRGLRINLYSPIKAPGRRMDDSLCRDRRRCDRRWAGTCR